MMDGGGWKSQGSRREPEIGPLIRFGGIFARGTTRALEDAMSNETTARHYVLDRIEDGRWALLEPEDGGPHLHTPREWLPSTAAEGDLIVAEAPGDGSVRFRVDPEGTAARASRVRELREQLRRGPEGDIAL
jgi:hypothetical protein